RSLCDAHCLAHRKLTAPLQAIAHRLAVEILHDEVGNAAFGDAGVDDVDDVGVTELTESAPLVAHAGDEVVAGGERSQERLQDVASPELDMLHFVNRPHAAGPDEAYDTVGRARDQLSVLILAHPAGRRHGGTNSSTASPPAAESPGPDCFGHSLLP